MLHQPDRIELGTFDVVICGGGPAGCAAAIAAARQGAATLLIEKDGYLGGATVSQLVSVVLSTNGVDFQGIWHDWARQLLATGSIAGLHRSPSPFYADQLDWYRASLDPEGVKRAWDTLLAEAGVTVLLQATVCDVLLKEHAITGLHVLTRAGLGIIRAGRVIDASGNALVCHLAGVPWHRGVQGKLWPQAVSLVAQWGWKVGAGEHRTPGMPGTYAYRPERFQRVDLKEVDPLDPWAVTRALRTLQAQTWELADHADPERYLIATAVDLGVRTSRIIDGMECVSDDDAWQFRKRADSIARASWELDVHAPDDAPLSPRMFHSRSEQYAERCKALSAGEYFDIPYGCLVPAGIDNLLAAGRIVSSGYLAQGSLRIQQTCMATGEAAGTAAALSLQASLYPRDLDPLGVAKQLANDRALVEPAFALLRKREETNIE